MSFKKITFVIVLSFLFQTANAVEEITYKSSKFLISEQDFVQKFREANFLCKTDLIGVGRQCESSSATYANEKVENTVANFIDDKFVSVSLFYSENNNPNLLTLKYGVLVGALEDKYGKNRKIEKSVKNGDYSETQKWQDSKSNSISINFFKPKQFNENLWIYIESKEGRKIYDIKMKKINEEIKSRKNSDM